MGMWKMSSLFRIWEFRMPFFCFFVHIHKAGYLFLACVQIDTFASIYYRSLVISSLVS